MTETTKEPNEYMLIGPSEDGQVSDVLAGLNSKESRQRLQALFTQWLRMENVVVITGAGCSVSAGGRTMDALEASVLSTVKKLKDFPTTIQPLLDARAEEKKTDNPASFEDWLSLIVNATYLATLKSTQFTGLKWNSEPAPTAEDLLWFKETIGRLIFAECSLRLPPTTGKATPSKIPAHLAFLSKLVARDSNLGRIHLFTLNYDTLFEQALERLGIQYFDGFSGRAEARFDPAVYGLDIYFPGEVAEGRVRRFDKFLHFYKLHGSIHWRVNETEVIARHPDLAVTKRFSDASPAEKPAIFEEIAETIPAAGILPTANKFVQTLSMPFSHLFRSFQVRLGIPQTFLLVLGYGFGDDHVTRMIETALMNPSLVLLIVEPNPESPTIQRVRSYKELGKRAFVLTTTPASFSEQNFRFATFDDFALNVMPDVQWLDDLLRLRRFETALRKGDADKGGQ